MIIMELSDKLPVGIKLGRMSTTFLSSTIILKNVGQAADAI